MGISIILLANLFAMGEQKFFDMAEAYLDKGCVWHWVGRTEVTNEIALPAIEKDGTKVYYLHICEK
tara:strand:- start:776 stop:973 length:198 start_codon:yes stop_codon:yes gene_type:complete